MGERETQGTLLAALVGGDAPHSASKDAWLLVMRRVKSTWGLPANAVEHLVAKARLWREREEVDEKVRNLTGHLTAEPEESVVDKIQWLQHRHRLQLAVAVLALLPHGELAAIESDWREGEVSE